MTRISLPQAVKETLCHPTQKVFPLFVLTGICLILTCFKAPHLSEILLPVGLALGGFASLGLMPLRGSLKIQTAETTYNSGSDSGFHGWRGQGQGTTSEEIYRNEILLESEKTYEAGSENTYQFSIPTPTPPDLSKRIPENAVAEALLEWGLIRCPHIDWEVKAQLISKGVDLIDIQPITIHHHPIQNPEEN